MGQLIQNPSSVPVSVAADWETLLNVNAAGNVGYNAITPTNWDAGTLAPAIAAGSMIEINGSIAYFQNQEAIGGIQTGLNYLQFVVSGTTVTPSWTLTAPGWNAAKAGWFVGSNRASGHVCYQSGGAYTDKYNMPDSPMGIAFKRISFTYPNTNLGSFVHNIPSGDARIIQLSCFVKTTGSQYTNIGVYGESNASVSYTDTTILWTTPVNPNWNGYLGRVSIGYRWI
jgi:hypothetical protein